MKAIIKGKRYDTDTAEDIATTGNDLSRTDFHYFAETLYRTQKGAWFLHGEGGALTKYAKPYGNGRAGGEEIIPLTEEDVRAWLEIHNLCSVFEKYFSDQIEDA